jgi:hypothetical protein
MALISEGRVDERASVLALQIEILRRCRRPEAVRLESVLRGRQLSLPSWHGRLFEILGSTAAVDS